MRRETKILVAFTIALWVCIVSVCGSDKLDKSVVYRDAVNFYTFDTNGSDAKGDNPLLFTNVTLVSDLVRGMVAEIKHDNIGYMEFSKPVVSSEEFSICTWFYYESSYIEWWQTIFEFANDQNNNNFYFCPRAENVKVVAESKVDSKWEEVHSNTYHLPNDTWIHLAMTFNKGAVAIYANGSLIGSGTLANTIAGLDFNRFFIGANPLPGRFYRALDARYDDFAVYNFALAGQQVYAIANDTLPEAPDYEPFVFETEDYVFGNWQKETNNDIVYSHYTIEPAPAPADSTALQCGFVEGKGLLSVWAKVFASDTTRNPLWIKVDDEGWKASDPVAAGEEWKWVLLQKQNILNNNYHLLKLAPADDNLKIDKLLATFNWDYNPDSSYAKTDTLAPSVPGNLTVRGTTEYTTTIAWNSSGDTNDKIAGYDIFNGDRLFVSAVDTFIKPKLQAAVSYSFSVRAKDPSGNVSARSKATSANTISLTFSPDLSTKLQTIHHFGSSDAWAAEFIGLWPSEKRDSLAKVLFSSRFLSDGDPEGIALSGWRYRIGDGSRDQTPSNGMSAGNWFKATQCPLNSDGIYDWSKQAGNVWMIKKAREYGVPSFTGWTDSPPYFMTKSGYVFRETGVTTGYNLKTDLYDDFAGYLAEVSKHFESEGILFDVISPVNEPQWGWDYAVGNGGQPGSFCSNAELSNLVKAIDKTFIEKDVKSKILISEAGDIRRLYEGTGTADNQIQSFWLSGSANYIGNLPSLSNYVAGHGYFSESSVNQTISTRQKLFSKLQSTNENLQYWQTEYSLLSDGYSKEKSNMEPMDYSLFLARVIHYDLTVGSCTGWDWWSTFSRPWGEDHKYRFALINWWPNVDNNSCNDGTFELTKNLWTMGNFSHFIRPGYTRVGTSRSDFLTAEQSADKQLISAWLSPNSDSLIMVVINYAEYDQSISINCKNIPFQGSLTTLKPYVTSKDCDLKAMTEINISNPVTFKARSVTTLVGKIQDQVIDNITDKQYVSQADISVFPNPASDIIYITVENCIAHRVDVFDITGIRVASAVFNTDKLILDISHLNIGCYIISVQHGNTTDNGVIIINR